ncbi:MAG: SDR family NAD(P)-dependent oxidoreductase [Rhodococcus sp. (in: high G+C Gram-positive bacteria)]
MLLDGANALVYGGGGVLGGRLAVALAQQGARVHLAGRSLERMHRVVEAVRLGGGYAEAAVLDVMDEVEVDEYVDIVAACSGSIDISIDVIFPSRSTSPDASIRSVGSSAVQRARRDIERMEVADLERPVLDALRAHYVTARAAARHMMCQHSGLILVPRCAASATRLDAQSLASVVIDRLAGQLAGELESTGVHVAVVDADPSSPDETTTRLVAAASHGDA